MNMRSNAAGNTIRPWQLPLRHKRKFVPKGNLLAIVWTMWRMPCAGNEPEQLFGVCSAVIIDCSQSVMVPELLFLIRWRWQWETADTVIISNILP